LITTLVIMLVMVGVVENLIVKDAWLNEY
jgi:hypothetical protein